MCRHGAGGNMEDRRRQFTGDLVHVGDHQQQALRCRKGRRQRTGLQCAMDSAGGPPFGLQFDDAGNASPDIRLALRRPFVGQLPHAGGRGDRVNGDHFRNAVSHVGDSFIAVDGQHIVHVRSCPEMCAARGGNFPPSICCDAASSFYADSGERDAICQTKIIAP